jgi:hypothetical protein
MAVFDKLRLASGVGVCAAVGLNATLIGVKLSAPSLPAAPNKGDSSTEVVVPDGVR